MGNELNKASNKSVSFNLGYLSLRYRNLSIKILRRKIKILQKKFEIVL